MVKNDIVCLTETWKDRFDSEILSWDDPISEYSKNANRQYKYGRSSGGTSVFIKCKIESNCKIEHQDAYHT